MTRALWIVQILLALTFLFAGGMKLAAPLDLLTEQLPLPGLFIRFIGLAEVLGGLGLALPGLVRVRPSLTSLAAFELANIMLAATAYTLATGEVVGALLPVVLGLLATFVAYGRWRVAPFRHTAQRGTFLAAS